MRRLGRGLQAGLVDAHLWVGAAAAGLCLYAGSALGLPLRGGPPWVVFAATVLIYGVDDIFDARGAPKRRSVARWAVPPAAVLLVVGLWQAPAHAVMVVAAGTVPCLAYALPLCGRRLRDLAGVKPWFVTVALTVGVVVVPLAWSSSAETRPDVAQVLRLAAILSGLVFCNVCLFDLGDRQADARCDVRTIPVRLGTTRTRVLCLSVCAAMLVALSASFGPGLHPDPALWLAILATAGCFALPQPGAALLADGIPVSLGLLVLLGG